MSNIPTGLNRNDCSAEVPRSPSRVSQEEITKAQPCSAMECRRNDCGDCKDVEKPPLYLPQPEDEYPLKPTDSVGLPGPWVTGKVTCSPKGGITGVRPVANRYSITLCGPSEWRAHNLNVLQQTNETCDAEIMTRTVKQYVDQTYKAADKVQQETTEKLKNRAHKIYHWKEKVKDAIFAIAEEIKLLQAEDCRLKRFLSTLNIPISISGEHLQLRSSRLDSDLVRDEVEEELIKEIALCSEVRDLMRKNGEQIKTQLMELHAAKERMESDWSDKVHAYDIDAICVNLTNDSPILMWKAGATRFAPDQSTSETYDEFTQETLAAGEAVRQKSVNLRTTLKTMYDNCIKEISNQASCVNVTISEKVKLTEECLHQMENELLRCLRELANTEKLIEELRDLVKGLNNTTKLAQTRLSNRLQRRNVENCRDTAQFALIEEVKSLGERTSGMLGELKRAEKCQTELVKKRGQIEHEIIVKRKTLFIDKERGQPLRAFFPSATDLSGFCE